MKGAYHMAITLDTIVNKEFKVVKNGYDNNEVEAFLDEILEEMENREAQTDKLREQVETLTLELQQAHAQIAGQGAPVGDRCSAENDELREQVKALTLELEQARAQLADRPAAAAKNQERRTSESFEFVLSKAQSAYDEILAAADARAEQIVNLANAEAAGIREAAQGKIADLTEKLDVLRRQSADYYASVKKAMDAQAASMDQLKKLL